MKLSEIGYPSGRKVRHPKRVGRGNASGHGGTSCRGHKGQKSRSGGLGKVGFEGGQMPLRRRLPKRGFTNIFRREFVVVNLDQLAHMPGGSEVTSKSLCELGVTKRPDSAVKLLGRGEIERPIVVKLHAVSASARRKVEAAGGKVEVIGG